MEEELKICRKRSNRSLGILCGFMIAQLSLHEFKCILMVGFVLLGRFMMKNLRFILKNDQLSLRQKKIQKKLL